MVTMSKLPMITICCNIEPTLKTTYTISFHLRKSLELYPFSEYFHLNSILGPGMIDAQYYLDESHVYSPWLVVTQLCHENLYHTYFSSISLNVMAVD